MSYTVRRRQATIIFDMELEAIEALKNHMDGTAQRSEGQRIRGENIYRFLYGEIEKLALNYEEETKSPYSKVK